MLLLSLLLAGASALQAQTPLPTPAQFVRFLDLRCYKIPNQPPINVPLQLDHLNPVFVAKGFPPEFVKLQEAQELCVPVRKEQQLIDPAALPFLRYADLKCYRIFGPSLDFDLILDQLNPVMYNLFGPQVKVTVREPQQLCVPVAKAGAAPPPDIARLIRWLDVKCYRIDADPFLGNRPINLTHLNPLFAGIPSEQAKILEPAPIQLCVPVAKNQTYPPDDVRRIISYSDVLCYQLAGLPLNRQLQLRHLNPVLQNMGLPLEDVFVTETTKLCVPVAKNGDFPPG
ncbi:MAG: hypothetical protein ACJ75H_05000 [Thermoanaerobaculia bacterium]